MNDLLKTDDKRTYRKLLAKVKRIAFFYKFLLFAEIAMIFVLVVGMVLQLGIIIDNIFHLNRILRSVYFLFLVGSAGYIIVRKFVPLWEKGLSGDEAAVLVEKKYPHLNNILINSLQLGRQKVVSSGEIVALIVREAYSKTKKLNFYKALRVKKSLKLMSYTFLLVCICAIYIHFFPTYWKNGFVRILNPFSGKQAIRRTSLEVFPSINSSVLNGADFEVQLTAKGKIPDSAFIYYQVKGEKHSFETMEKDKENPSRFTYKFKKTVKPFTYYIKAGDAKTKSFDVSVVYPPFVSSIDMRVIYPDYMNKGDEEIKDSSGNLSVIKGSSVIMAVSINKKLSEMEGAQMVINADEQKIVPFHTDFANELYKLKFVADQSFSYRIKLKDKKGFENSESIIYVVDIVEDKVPLVEIEAPESDIKISEKATVGVRVAAQDDYGLTRVELMYSINGGEKRKIILRKSDLPSVTDVAISYLWDIESLGLSQGDVVRYWINVFDNDSRSGFKKATSAVHFIRVMDLYDKKKIVLRKLQNVLYQMKMIFSRQMFLMENTKKITDKAKIYFKDTEKVCDVQKDIVKRVKVVNDTLISLKQNEKSLKDMEDKLTLLLLPVSKIMESDIYDFESNIGQMLADEKIRDRKEILKGFVSWQRQVSSKFFQIWEKGGSIYSDLVQANILYKLESFKEKQNRIKESLTSQYVEKGKNIEDVYQYIVSQQKSLNDDVRSFLQDIKKDTQLLKSSVLDLSVLTMLENVIRSFLKDELILSDMNKSLSAIKNKEDENALKYVSLSLNKIKKTILAVSNPYKHDVKEKLKKTLNLFSDVEKRLQGFIDIEKSFEKGLEKKQSENKKIFNNEISFHVRLKEILSLMVEEFDLKKSGETRKFTKGIKSLKKGLEKKQRQIMSMNKNDIPGSLRDTRELIGQLRDAKMYFAKLREKVKQAQKQIKKTDTKEEKKSGVPAVKIVEPGRDIVVLTNAEVPIKIKFKDDYGVSSLDLVYMVDGAPTEKIINLGEYETLKEEGQAEYKFLVKSLGIEGKAVVFYYARAVDDDIFGKNIGKSTVYRLTVIPPGYILEEENENQLEDDKHYEEVKNLVKEVLLLTFEEQRKIKTELSLLKEGKILLKEDRQARYNKIIERQRLIKEEIESVLNIIDLVGKNNKDMRVKMFLEKVKPVLIDISTQDIPYIVNELS